MFLSKGEGKMSKTKKILIIASVAAVIVGIIIGICGLCAMDFDFTKLSNVRYETVTYPITKSFNNINIDISSEDVDFNFSETEKCEVTCLQDDDISYTVEVIDDTLTIKYNDTGKMHFVYFGFNFTNPKITISLPKKDYGSLYLKSGSGSINIPENFHFSNANVFSSSGEIYYFAETLNKLNIETSSGDFSIGNTKATNVIANAKSGDINIFSSEITSSIEVNATSGNITLSDITASNISAECNSGEQILKNVIAHENINAQTTSGDIDLINSDSHNICISSKSGDVYGSLLTEKIFMTDTQSGDVDIPSYNTLFGNGDNISFDNELPGKCEITTSSGDITIVVRTDY